MREEQGSGMASLVPANGGGALAWHRWVPYAAVAWSLGYAALGIYWIVGGRGFPYTAKTASDVMAPLLARFGPGVAWIVVIMAGIPAAGMGAAMLRGVRNRAFRPLFTSAGVMLAGVLLLLMTGLGLLVLVGYIPFAVLGRFPAGKAQEYLQGWTDWGTIHQLLCLLGGFIWLGATVCYGRLSAGACPYCGRRDGPEGWQSPNRAARWGRIAVYVSMVAPVLYAFTRYAWALGFPLGMTEEHWHSGQQKGLWISGLFLATFGLVGAAVTLGLVQRWGEVFPRWMIGLARRRVPIALAVVPASLVSVLVAVGGIVIWSSLPQMIARGRAAKDIDVVGAVVVGVGPTLLFPVWGVALAVATLAYYYRRRKPCSVCGRGASTEVGKPSSGYQKRQPDDKEQRPQPDAYVSQ